MKPFNLNAMWPFKRKKKSTETQPSKFIFSVLEGHWIGDQYQYTVEANSRKEAAIKLVNWFFGSKPGGLDTIEQDHFIVTRPMSEVHRVVRNDIFTYHDADMMKQAISSGRDSSRDWLIKFAKENDIDLANRF